MESNLKQVVYFRKEEQEHGFIIEKVKDYYRRQELAKRTINRYAFSFKNFTSVLAGWTFTSTALAGKVKCSTQAGNLPAIIWLR